MEEEVRVEQDLGNVVRKKRHEDERRQEENERETDQEQMKCKKLAFPQRGRCLTQGER